jgi:pyruvate formate lyase activating enzyme
LKALLETLHDELGFHTCLETCGHAPWGVLASILPHTDMVLLDVKHMDDERHRQGTGQGNAVILENAGRLARTDVRTLIRLPLIPGFNDDSGNITALARFMKETGLPAIEILPYHEFGVSKYEALGKTYTLYRDKKPETRETQEILTGYGLDVAVAGQQ